MARLPALLTTVLCLSICQLATAAAAGELIVVQLQNGRTFAGQIDDRSDALRLRLQAGRRTTRVLRTIRWSQIRAATVGGERLTAQQLKSRRLELARTEAKRPTAQPLAGGKTYAARALEALDFQRP